MSYFIEHYDADELSNNFFEDLRGGKGLGTPSRMRGDIFKKKRNDTMVASIMRREASKRRKLV